MNRPQLCFVSDFRGTPMAPRSLSPQPLIESTALVTASTHERLRDALPDFRTLSVEAFLERHEPSLELVSAQSTAVA
jgi:hypothetical protein